MIADDIPVLMVLDETTEFTDMAVLVGDDRIPCHKAVVCRFSPVIYTALTSTFKEGQTGEFPITDPCATVDNVRQFLLAMYNDWDAEMDKHVHEIYRLSHVYLVPKVMNKACAAFGRLLNTHNFWKIATTHEGNPCPAITKQCELFVMKQSPHVVDKLMSDTNEAYMDAAVAHPNLVLAFHLIRSRAYYPTVDQSLSNVGHYVKEATSALRLEGQIWGPDTIAYKSRIPLMPLIRYRMYLFNIIVSTEPFVTACGALDKTLRADRCTAVVDIYQRHKVNPAITSRPECPFKIDAKIQDWAETKSEIEGVNKLLRTSDLPEDKEHVATTHSEWFGDWCSAFSQRWKFLAKDLINGNSKEIEEYVSLHMSFVGLMMLGKKDAVKCCVTHRTLMA